MNKRKKKKAVTSQLKIYILFAASLLIILSCNTKDTDKTHSESLIAAPIKKPAKPNIIVIMSDDDDFGGIQPYGGEVKTPNINSLSENGIRFSNFYNNSRCSPSRASLLTGMYPQKVGVGDLCDFHTTTNLPSYMGFLNPNFKILPQFLKDIGYVTIMCGKWHLGGTNEGSDSFKIPINKGFDYFFGILKGASNYFGELECEYYLQDECFDSVNHPNFYSTDMFTDYAMKFINNATSENAPFFLYLPYTAPHAPVGASAELIEEYRKVYAETTYEQIGIDRINRMKELGVISKNWSINMLDEKKEEKLDSTLISKLSVHTAMMDIVDQNVGKLVGFLKEKGQYENTIILYCSDNGGAGTSLSHVYNVPFKGGKSSLFEGGIKTHCIISWPEKIKKPSINKERLHLMDLLPTILELTDTDYSEDFFDGKSFSNILINKEEKELERSTLFWDLYGQQAAIDNNWKWINDRDGADFLYNLKLDGTETKNLVEEHPQILAKIKKKHQKYVEDNEIADFEVYKKLRTKNKRKIRRKKKRARERKQKGS